MFAKLLQTSGYDSREAQYLIEGFTTGFDLEYQGPWNRQDTVHNLPFRDGVGNDRGVWQKMRREVEAGRFAGPYSQIPFKNYVQSPVGLVPKSNGQTRLIFHLSYDFKGSYRSVNH